MLKAQGKLQELIQTETEGFSQIETEKQADKALNQTFEQDRGSKIKLTIYRSNQSLPKIVNTQKLNNTQSTEDWPSKKSYADHIRKQ